jgi:NADH-quinone oxidoreductase subunit H
MDWAVNFFAPQLVPIIIILLVVMVLPLVAGYVVLLERKIMADMQARLGPMRVGPHGLLQPIADALKLLIKEDIIPEEADKVLFWMAPLISVTAAMLSFAALTFAPGTVTLLGHASPVAVADMNIGLLFILAVSSMGIYGIVLGGWASNNHYSLLGALRGSAQLVSYEVAAGMALVAGVLLAGSLSTKTIIETQVSNGVWFVFLSPVAFFIYLVASIAETNRAPFDLPEAESELVAGYMTEYSGFRWAVYFLAEYANMIVVSGIAVTIFFGGWQRPFGNTALFNFLDFAPAAGLGLVGLYCFWRIPKLKEKPHRLTMPLFGLLLLGLAALLALPLAVPVVGGVNIKTLLHGAFWFLAKVTVYLYAFMWIRFTFPRYRFDQLMKLGWHFLIPLSLVNLFAVATALLLSKPAELGGAGYALGPAMLAATAVTMLAGGWLAWLSEQRELRDRATTAAPAGD